MSPESRSVNDCGALRQACRDAIYEKMDTQHRETLAVLGEIKGRLAYQDGQASIVRGELRTEINAQEAARIDARSAVVRNESIWQNPIVLAVVSAVLTAAIMGGLAAYFLHGVKP